MDNQFNNFLAQEGLLDADGDADGNIDDVDLVVYDERAVNNRLDGDEDAANDDDEEDLKMAAHQFLQVAYRHFNNRPGRDPVIPMVMLNIDAYNDTACEALFRFRADEIRDIAVALRLPDIFILDNGSRVLALEALCLTLRRFAYPCRLIELTLMSGRSVGMLRRILTCTLRWIHQRWAPTLLTWDHARLQPRKLEQFAAAIHAAGSPLRGVIGFIDGTVRPIAHPVEGQEQGYNGHHSVHAMKYQAVTSPDGVIIHLSGPYQGRHHDTAMYRASGLEDILFRWAKDRNGAQMYLYGGPGYPISPVMQVPYPNLGITPVQQRFNERMSAVRGSVEWTFGHVLQYFVFSDFKKSQRSLLSQVHLHYTVSIIFSNIHTCITETNSSVGRFNVQPPTLEEYLHN